MEGTTVTLGSAEPSQCEQLLQLAQGGTSQFAFLGGGRNSVALGLPRHQNLSHCPKSSRTFYMIYLDACKILCLRGPGLEHLEHHDAVRDLDGSRPQLRIASAFAVYWELSGPLGRLHS